MFISACYLENMKVKMSEMDMEVKMCEEENDFIFEIQLSLIF